MKSLPLFLLIFSSLGCASVFGPHFAADEKACAVAVAHDVEQRAASILLAGGLTYEADLTALAVDVGKDGAVCAIQAAIADFEQQQQQPAAPTAAPPAVPVNSLVMTVRPAEAGAEQLAASAARSAAIERGKATLAKLGKP